MTRLFIFVLSLSLFSGSVFAAGGGGGAGGQYEKVLYGFDGKQYTSINSACAAAGSFFVNSELTRPYLRPATGSSYVVTGNGGNTAGCDVTITYSDRPAFTLGVPITVTYPEPEPEPEPDPDKPPIIPPPEVPSPDCNVCNAVYQLNLKLTEISNINNTNNYDMRVSINNMQTTINNIDNSITDLSVNQEITNNNITSIITEVNNLTTNIENNNITQNEIKNEITNIYETMNDYSLQLGDIKLAMGDIDLSLKNTNKLVLDLGLDLDFIKNKLVNDTSKDYTPYLNDIIALLSPCVPTDEVPCPAPDEVGGYDDTALIALLTDMQDFMKADFVPSDDPNEVEVTDLTDINLDRNLINFGAATCPPDNEFNTSVNGFAFSGGFKHKPLCDFFTMLAPFIKAFAGFSAAIILGGGLRR